MTITELIKELQKLKKWHGGNPEVFLSCIELERGFEIDSIVPVGQDVCINIV